MSLSASTIWEVESGGSDTLNGGAFDPSQTAGMLTNGAATVATSSAPIFTSASYNFVAGDVGAWLYIASGSTWIAGWYKIASVTSNAATLRATAGLAVLAAGPPSTATGCATTASPSSATWTIDYSQQLTARFAYTDLTAVGAGLLVSSVAFPFGKQQVGNSLVITGGTNFTAGYYVIASVSVGLVATVVGAANITTGAGVSGTGGQGGCLASPGRAAGIYVAGNIVWMLSGTYLITTASTNVSGGCISLGIGGASNTALVYWLGYNTIRYGAVTGTPSAVDQANKPLLQASGIATATLFNAGIANIIVKNLAFDGQSLTAIRGFNNNNIGNVQFWHLKALNCTNTGLYINSVNAEAYFLEAVGCSTAGQGIYIEVSRTYACVSHGNSSIPGITLAGSYPNLQNCLSYNNSGAGGQGYNITTRSNCINCVAYGNGSDGFKFASNFGQALINCIAYGNTGYGFNGSSAGNAVTLIACAAGNNTAGTTNNIGGPQPGAVTLTADPFTNAAGGDFSLNSTADGGAACKAAGLPGAFPAALTTGYPDIGAVQSRGGGLRLVTMTGGMSS